MPLYQHQKNAISEVANNSRCVVRHFCGTGKTRIIVEVILGSTGFNIVVFPTLALIEQFEHDYLPEFRKVGVKCLRVCSKKEAENTTQPEEILEFFNEGQRGTIVVTYKSLQLVTKILQKYKTQIQYFFFDEAHHVTENQTKKLLFGKSSSRKGFCTYLTNVTRQLTSYNLEILTTWNTVKLMMCYQISGLRSISLLLIWTLVLVRLRQYWTW